MKVAPLVPLPVDPNDGDWLGTALSACVEGAEATRGLAYDWGVVRPGMSTTPRDDGRAMAVATTLLALPRRWFFEVHRVAQGHARLNSQLRHLPRKLKRATLSALDAWHEGADVYVLAPLATRHRGMCVLLAANGRTGPALKARLKRMTECLAMGLALRTSVPRPVEHGALIWQELFEGKWSIVRSERASSSNGLMLVRQARGRPGAVMAPREQQVLALVLEGHANKWIAWRLGIATATVASHLGRAIAKLGLSTRNELLAFFGPTG